MMKDNVIERIWYEAHGRVSYDVPPFDCHLFHDRMTLDPANGNLGPDADLH
jgi:hypothetical protein